MTTLTRPDGTPDATAPLDLAVPATTGLPLADPGPPPPDPGTLSGPLRLARLLVLLEVLVAAVSTVEATVVAAVGFGAFGAAAGTAALTVTLARQARRLGRGRVTRTLRLCQWAFLGFAVVDLLIALLLVHGLLPPVSLLVRVVLPVAVLRLARRPR